MSAADNPKHWTTAASTAHTFTFAEDFPQVEVLNLSGTARVYVSYGDATPVAVALDGCDVVPAAIGAALFRVRSSGPTIVNIISPGVTDISVKGIRNG
jgi:hypothetical protein